MKCYVHSNSSFLFFCFGSLSDCIKMHLFTVFQYSATKTFKIPESIISQFSTTILPFIFLHKTSPYTFILQDTCTISYSAALLKDFTSSLSVHPGTLTKLSHTDILTSLPPALTSLPPHPPLLVTPCHSLSLLTPATWCSITMETGAN